MTTASEFRALARKVASLEKQVSILEAEQAVRKLQHTYGYYLDKCLYQEVVDLFAEDCEVRFMRGIFRGRKGAHRLYIGRFRKNFTDDYNGPVHGFLLDHPQLQDIVHVAANGQSARGRFRSMMQAGRHYTAGSSGSMMPRQWWEAGIYENEYVVEDGTWKIKVLHYRPVFHATFENGWAYTPPDFVPFFTEKDCYPKNKAGPDAIDRRPVLWPDVDVVPFHYAHPVTGKRWKRAK